jgi:hypothetical protein
MKAGQIVAILLDVDDLEDLPRHPMDEARQLYRVKVGGQYWFEYHCYEADDSCDAALWYKSHQQITVISMIESGGGKTEEERGYNGHSAAFRIRFKDGSEGDAFEDELLDSKSEFTRPDPPLPPNLRKGKKATRSKAFFTLGFGDTTFPIAGGGQG